MHDAVVVKVVIRLKSRGGPESPALLPVVVAMSAKRLSGPRATPNVPVELGGSLVSAGAKLHDTQARMGRQGLVGIVSRATISLYYLIRRYS